MADVVVDLLCVDGGSGMFGSPFLHHGRFMARADSPVVIKPPRTIDRLSSATRQFVPGMRIDSMVRLGLVRSSRGLNVSQGGERAFVGFLRRLFVFLPLRGTKIFSPRSLGEGKKKGRKHRLSLAES